MKNWPKFKLIQDIKIFLEFTNLYWQFIQSFSRIASLFMLILKIIKLFDKLVFGKNNSSRLISRKNNSNNKLFINFFLLY